MATLVRRKKFEETEERNNYFIKKLKDAGFNSDLIEDGVLGREIAYTMADLIQTTCPGAQGQLTEQQVNTAILALGECFAEGLLLDAIIGPAVICAVGHVILECGSNM